MSDEEPTRPIPEGDPHSAAPSSLKGLTMALGIEPAKPGHDPLLGCDIGGVRIVRLIAEGGMGRVYEGKQEKPKRTVAVKVMRPGYTSPSVLKRFEYEAEVLGRLQHPGIAHIYSVGVHHMANATVPYFIMEYIADARTLTKYADELKLPTRQRLDLFRSVCDAVAHGHQKGVIHRDLKPSNILVDASGQPKVIDFGVARATDSDMALTTMQTDVGQLIGTLQYMSPEQFKADPNDIDVRSDVYALGVILYELLTGKMPYDVKKKAIHEVARIVQEDDPTPLSSFSRALKGDVAVIAGKCLEKDRGRRYSSASELGVDIWRHLTGEPISASPPGFIDGLTRLARKHRAAAAAVAGLFGILVVAVIGIGIFARRAERERQIALEERDRAQVAKATAEAAETRANQEKETAAIRLYEANLYRIQQSIREHNFPLARSLLQEVTTEHHRGKIPFEVRHLDSLLRQEHVVLDTGRHSAIQALAFSPDGTRIATGRSDGTRLWDVATGRQVAAIEGRRERIQALAFSPDGTRIAISGEDNIRLWDVATGERLVLLKAIATERLAFSPDGTRIATIHPNRYASLGLWDAATGKQVAVLGQDYQISHVAFSPDGSRIATVSDYVRLWDVSTATESVALEGRRGGVSALAFSPDGTRIATTDWDAKTRLFDVATGKQVAVLEGHRIKISALAFSPDGTRIATGGGDNIRLWDVATGSQVAMLEGHRGVIQALVFSPDGTRLAAGGTDRTARMWDVKTGKSLAVLAGHGERILALAFSPDGTWLATGGVDNIRLWNVSTGNQFVVLEGHQNHITELAFSPDGTRLATGSYDKTTRLWDVATAKQLVALEGHSYIIRALAFSPDGTRLATGSNDNARLWDVATGKQVAMLDGFVQLLAFSPDGTRLASSGNGITRLWDVATGKQSAMLKVYASELAFSPDGTRLATGSYDKTTRLWDVATGQQLAVLEGHQDQRIVALAFSPDGTRLATGGGDNARLWDAVTGKQLAVLEGHRDRIKALAFSPDGTRLATGGRDNARLWDVATGEQLVMLEGHGMIENLAFSPDGTRLVTGSGGDNTARLWDVVTGKQVAVLEGHHGQILALAFSRDGDRLATGSNDSTARLWGASNADIYKSRVETVAIEQRLDDRVKTWLQDGPESAVAKLKEAEASLTADEFRVASNMILSRSADGSSATNHE